MKKVSVILLLVLGAFGVFAQNGKPCVDQYKQDRTLSEMREILMRDGPYYDNLRMAYAEAINYNIGKMVIYSSKKGISDLFDNTIFVDSTFVNPAEFQNGVRYGNTVRFTNLTGQPSEYYAAMHFCGKDYIYAKVACINPQKAKIRGIFEEEQPKPMSLPLPNPETGFVPAVKDNTNTSSVVVIEETDKEVDQDQFKTVIVKTWFGKNWWWVVPAGGAILYSGGSLIAKAIKDNRRITVIDPRTMPPGLPALEPVQQPGLPADPRSMPSGLSGMNFNRSDFSTVSGQRLYGVSFNVPLGGLRFH